MKTRSVHRVLEEFGGENVLPSVATVVPMRRRAEEEAGEPVSPTGPLAQAYARGFDEGRRNAEIAAETQVELLRAQLDQQHDVALARFSEAMASELSVAVRQQIEAMHANIADQVACALIPILSHVLTQTAIRELATSLQQLTRDEQAISIEVRGPQELIDRVWRRLLEIEPIDEGARGTQFRFAACESPEVRIKANNALIESRLGDWIARLAEVVGR